MRWITLLLVLFVHQSFSFECSSDDNCNSPYGVCENNKCVCQNFHGGDSCSYQWQDNSAWNVFYWIHVGLVLAFHFCAVLFISYQLFITFRYAKVGNWTTWNVNTAALGSILAGSLLRVIGFAIDPNGIRGTLGQVPEYIIFNTALILYFQAGMMVFLYWVELQHTKGSLTFVSKYRPIYITFIVVMTVIEFSTTVWRANVQTYFANLIQNLFYVLLFIIMIIVSTWGGISLIRVLKQTSQNRITTSTLDDFSKRLLTYILLSDLVWISAILTVIVYVAIGPTSSPWLWLPCHYLFRTQEALTILLFCKFTRKKKPAVDGALHSTGSVTTLKTIGIHTSTSDTELEVAK